MRLRYSTGNEKQKFYITQESSYSNDDDDLEIVEVTAFLFYLFLIEFVLYAFFSIELEGRRLFV